MFGKLALVMIVAGLLWGCANEESKDTYPDYKADEHKEVVQDELEAELPEADAAEEAIRFVQDQLKATIIDIDGKDKLVTFEYLLGNEAAAAENVYVEIFIHDGKWRELIGLEHLRVNGDLAEPTALEPSAWHKGSVSISIPAAAGLLDEDTGVRLAESDAIEIQAIHAENKAVLASGYIRALDYVQDSLQS
ncbi:hypothetical protein D3P09_14055 [Paenibacillus pinisoli]|uniref:Uncharacterized protein n=1 Tax=Paenibacillus pinisoli TaxID=1276110 RepID=A0A3A6PI13_9BACL|nr:hypothetical protein [Paenibacillus pinisoli]RJX38668.1 hypothetical protein D3P09_14055 [Paenibacillus pinisoli]